MNTEVVNLLKENKKQQSRKQSMEQPSKSSNIFEILLLFAFLGSNILALIWLVQSPTVRYPEMSQSMINRMDLDGNGSVDIEEYKTISSGSLPFEVADLDRNNKIELWEVENLLLHYSPQMTKRGRLPQVF